MSGPPLLDRVLDILVGHLHERGFRPTGGGAGHVRPLGDGFESWVGLNHAHRPGGPVVLHPVIGVHHGETQAEVARLAGDPEPAAHAPTVLGPLEQWSPRHGDVTVADVGLVARRRLKGVAEAIDRSCRDLGARVDSLPALVEALHDPRMGLPWEAPLRRAVVLRRLGRVDEALGTVERAVAELGSRDDAAARRTRAFAQRFRAETVDA